jgi:hypothetical protein
MPLVALTVRVDPFDGLVSRLARELRNRRKGMDISDDEWVYRGCENVERHAVGMPAIELAESPKPQLLELD